MTQRDLLRRQARWQEFLAQYEFKIIYVKGKDNTIADTLSQVEPIMMQAIVAPIFSVTTDTELLQNIKAGYEGDEWCRKLCENLQSTPEARVNEGLIYWKDRLVILRYKSIRKELYRLAHDTLGHFGAEKSYSVLHDSFYWPNMRRDLKLTYIPSCDPC